MSGENSPQQEEQSTTAQSPDEEPRAGEDDGPEDSDQGSEKGKSEKDNSDVDESDKEGSEKANLGKAISDDSESDIGETSKKKKKNSEDEDKSSDDSESDIEDKRPQKKSRINDEDDDDTSSSEDEEAPATTKQTVQDDSGSESPSEESESEAPQATETPMMYDFDIMMAKKKEENSRKRRRRGYDIINDNDDIIADIINQMRDAVEADSEANKNRQAATNKLKLLPFVMNQLRKIDLRDAFIDSDVLSVMTEWLAPLPDKSLPHLNIRESLLKVLIEFNLYDVDRIKSSGIGKAVMYLYKHPKETKENKQRSKQLISAWSRPIFNLDTSFSAISREEREERDKELQRKANKRYQEGSDEDDQQEPRSSTKKPKEDPANVPKGPGDKGWIPRARVPAPSMRDYVIRPRSKVDGDVGKGSKKSSNMLENLMRKHQERKRASKQQRAVNMKIDKL